jgi:glycosyltransferase involved in cell wall biosynthesis
VRFFFVASVFPQAGHTVRAPTVVVRESLDALVELGHDVVLQPLLEHERDGTLTEAEERAIDWAAGRGIEVLPTLQASGEAWWGPRDIVRRALSSNPQLFFPAYALRDEMTRRVSDSSADVVFELWSGHALAACADVDVPMFAYYGNPDHRALGARLKHPELFDVATATLRNRIRVQLMKLATQQRKRANIALMRSARWSANVCATDAKFFADHGHPNAFYIQNMWAKSELEAPTPAAENKIVGSMGALSGTGNTFGLAFLANEVLPALDRCLGEEYSVHIFGAGEPTKAVAAALEHPRVQRRGYVDDIDGELRSAKLFLIMNNNNLDFIAGHTRVLHVWSLGCCLIAHRNMALAMPEIVHGENALLGETGDEVAELVQRALADEDLRQRIAAGGRATFEREFLPSTVMRRVVERIESGQPDGETSLINAYSTSA